MARRAIPTDASGLPDKPYFKIGGAARLCAVKPYVLAPAERQALLERIEALKDPL
jgi:hypothetical protein